MSLRQIQYFSNSKSFCPDDFMDNKFSAFIKTSEIESINGLLSNSIGTNFKYSVVTMKSGAIYRVNEVTHKGLLYELGVID